MAKIPVYEEQGIQMGGTVKLSGSDHVAEALQGLGGNIAQAGGVMAQIGRKKQALEDDLVELKLKNTMSAAEDDLNNHLLELRGSGISPEQYEVESEKKKKEYQDSFDGIISTSSKDKKEGYGLVINSFMQDKIPAMLRGAALKHGIEKQQTELGVQIVRAVTGGNTELAQKTIDNNRTILGEDRYQQFSNQILNATEQIQTASAYDEYVNLDSISAIEATEEEVKNKGTSVIDNPDGTTTVQNKYQYIDDTKWNAIERDRRAQKAKIRQGINDVQRDTYIETSVMFDDGTLTYQIIDKLEENGKNTDSIYDGPSLSPEYTRALRNKMNNDLEKKSASDKIYNKVESSKAKIRRSSKVNPEGTGALTRNIPYLWDVPTDLAKANKEIMDGDYSDDAKYWAITSLAREAAVSGNPVVASSMRNAMITISELEVKAQAWGIIPDVGKTFYDISKTWGQGTTVEQITEGLETSIAILKPKVDAAIQKELQSKFQPNAPKVLNFATEQDAEKAGLPDGTKIMINGKPAIWNN